MRTVIFDLDGTLADTSGDLLAAANACFRQMGHGDLLTRPGDAAIALRGGKRMLTEGLKRVNEYDDATVEAFYPVLLEAYKGAIDHHTVLYPGAMDAVEALKLAGYGVGICTNKPEALAEQLMQSLGVRGAFASLVGADTLPVRKPDPATFFEAVKRAGGDVSRSCMIGDTLTDHSTARAAGVPSILVDFGPGDEDVNALNPDAILSQFAELPDLVEKLLP